jgi:hypothetical protein
MQSRGSRGFTLTALILSLLISSSAIVYAQDTQAKYQRKSISYINAVLPIGSNVQLSKEQEKYLFKTIKKEIEMARFDYNPLPGNLLQTFNHEVRGVNSIDGVANVINDVLVPEIMRIVDLEKEMRAQGLVSEAERHSFVVEKARETGITAEDLEAVMNSAYIYVPIVSKAVVVQNAEKNTATATLKGGIIWFSIETDQLVTHVKLLVKNQSEATGFAKLDGKFSMEGRSLSGPQYAFATAAKTLARNLKVATQEIPDFQLTNPLANTGSGWVEFPMGKKEGLGVDDKFIIAEYYEKADGSLTQEKLGMVRVSKVADNRSKRADSRARTVIGGGYERGMTALEHPRLPIDLSFRFGTMPISIDVPGIDGSEEYTGTVYGGQLHFHYNLARATQISQFFFSLYGEAGSGTLQDFEVYPDEEAPAGLYAGAGAGFVKKIYVNRLHIGLEVLGSWSIYNLALDIPEDSSDIGEREEHTINSLGLTLNGNLEIALGYDVNIGGGISYRMFVPTDDWTYKVDGDEIDLGDEEQNDFDFGGMGFQVYFTWSLPSLGYDPVAAARGALGH